VAASSRNGTVPALTSEWGGLSPFLIASFFAVKKIVTEDKTAIRYERDMAQPEVLAPITDASIDATFNWQSPFENVGPDQKFSSFSALIQAGGFSSLIQSLQALLPAGSLDGVAKTVKDLEGKSNFTKLNSTQVFSGMPPLPLALTAHFRAYKDAAKEVRAPMDQLVAWALPKTIAQDGPLAAAVGGELQVFPSEVPQIIGMKYADKLFAPLVIEGFTYPLDGPRDTRGVLTRAAMPLRLATLTGIDAAKDWAEIRSGSNFAAYRY
jgi:hypothetical protein